MPHVLALVTLWVGVPLNMIVTIMLWRRSRAYPEIRVLRERFIVAVAVLVLVLVFGLIFLNNDRLPPLLTTDATKLITRAAVLIVAIVPACYWLILYWYVPRR